MTQSSQMAVELEGNRSQVRWSRALNNRLRKPRECDVPVL